MRWLLVLLCFLAAACAAQGARESGSAGPVKLAFHVEDAGGEQKKQFKPGEMVVFVFEVRNQAETAKPFSYTFPPHRVSVTAADSGEIAWQAFQGRMFAQVMRNERLGAGETKRFTVEWKPGSIGSYRASPEFNAFVGREREQLGRDLAHISLVVSE